MLTENQKERYARQLIIKAWTPAAQERLMSSTVMMVGAGGLGAPVGYYLTAVGVGKLIIVDSDIVELSNLNRQILHFTTDIGRLKTDSAKEKLTALNPDCQVETYPLRITPQNAFEMFQKADLIVDCTDGFTSKYLLNDTAVLTRKTLIHAGVLAFGGQLMVIRPDSACLRCVFPEPPPLDVAPPPSQVGILGAVAGAVGMMEALEAIKIITGIGKPLVNRMLTFDGLDAKWLEVKATKNSRCPICGENPTIQELKETYQAKTSNP